MIGLYYGLIARHPIEVVAQQVTEIERGTAKQCDVFQMACAAVIHHANEVADAGGVGCASAKLVEDMVHVDHNTQQAVLFGMKIGQFLRLRQKL